MGNNDLMAHKHKLPRVIWVLNVIFLKALKIFQGPRFLFFTNGTYNGITKSILSPAKSVGPAGPPSVNFGPHAILWAIGMRAHLILTPGYV